jgi:hypothetical protein
VRQRNPDSKLLFRRLHKANGQRRICRRYSALRLKGEAGRRLDIFSPRILDDPRMKMRSNSLDQVAASLDRDLLIVVLLGGAIRPSGINVPT